MLEGLRSDTPILWILMISGSLSILAVQCHWYKTGSCKFKLFTTTALLLTSVLWVCFMNRLYSSNKKWGNFNTVQFLCLWYKIIHPIGRISSWLPCISSQLSVCRILQAQNHEIEWVLYPQTDRGFPHSLRAAVNYLMIFCYEDKNDWPLISPKINVL